jgi:hypothetical protein
VSSSTLGWPVRWTVNPDVEIVEVDGGMVLLNITSGDIARLNHSAAVVMRAFTGGATADEALAAVAEAFLLQDREEAAREITTMVERLARADVLVEDTRPAVG